MLKIAIANVVVFLVLDFCAAQWLKVNLWPFQVPNYLSLSQDAEKDYRVRSDVFHHGFKPLMSVTTKWGGEIYPLFTNSLGFKDASARWVSPSSKNPRLLLIGDSFTEGIGLPFEKTFAGLLTAEFKKQNVEVLNAGVSSYSPTIYYAKVKYLLEQEKLKIDTLAVFIDISDIEDEANIYDREGEHIIDRTPRGHLMAINDGEKDLRHQFHSSFWQRNFISLYALEVYRHRQEFRGCSQNSDTAIDQTLQEYATRASWTYRPEIFNQYGKLGLEIATERMDKLEELVRQHGIHLIVTVYPWPHQVMNHDLDSLQVKHWSSWAQRKGVTFFNLFPLYMNQKDPRADIRQYYIPCDIHFNEAGNQVFAEDLLKNGFGFSK